MNKRDRIARLRSAAVAGEARAQAELARRYLDGDGVPCSPASAYRWNERAAVAGETSAMLALAEDLLEGEVVDSDPPSARSWLRRAADAGAGVAWWRLARCAAEGEGQRRDLPQALELARRGWKRTAEARCATLLGDLCDEELGDPTRAAVWYERGAQAGDENAMVSLGFLYRYGQGLAHDLDRAVRWYRRAAGADHPDALNNLGVCYEHGEGVAIDLTRAVAYRRRAARRGHHGARAWLAGALLDGIGGPRNVRRGERRMRSLAANDPEVALELGERYMRGKGLASDASHAREWLTQAGRAGIARGWTLLGVACWEGLGRALDPARAVRLWRLASRQGDGDAWYYLGRAHVEGRAVTHDPERARVCFERAARLGQGDAALILARPLLATQPEQALQLLEPAIAHEHPGALFELATCLLDGHGVARDVRRALNVFRIARARGQDSRVEIGNCRRLLREDSGSAS